MVILVEIVMPSFRMMNFDKKNNLTELRLNRDLLAKRYAKLPISIRSPSTIIKGLSIGHFCLVPWS